MKLNLKDKHVTQHFETETPNAVYSGHFAAHNNELQRVEVSVSVSQSVSVPDGNGGITTQSAVAPIGALTMNGNTLQNSSVPFSEKFPLYIADLYEIVKAITQPTEEKKTAGEAEEVKPESAEG